MTGRADIFAPASAEQVLNLVLAHPLAWVVSHGATGFRATPLPLRPRVGADGRIEALEGHLPRANPHCELLRREPDALILFSGPQGYVSPSWVSDRTWAPTWNYAVVQFLVKVAFDEAPARLEAHLDDLLKIAVNGQSGKPHDKRRRLPAASVFGGELVPADRLLLIERAIRAVQSDNQTDPWEVVEAWARAVLAEQ